MKLFDRTQDTLWTLIAAPTIWGWHFLLVYVPVAIRCAPNADVFEPIGATRLVTGIVTLVSMVLIALIFRRALREWRSHGGGVQHRMDTAQDREHFLEFSTLLLAALSFVGVIFDALPILFIEDCR